MRPDALEHRFRDASINAKKAGNTGLLPEKAA
jgi:hypothetical protein